MHACRLAKVRMRTYVERHDVLHGKTAPAKTAAWQVRARTDLR